jgi:hypothetical protein
MIKTKIAKSKKSKATKPLFTKEERADLIAAGPWWWDILTDEQLKEVSAFHEDEDDTSDSEDEAKSDHGGSHLPADLRRAFFAVAREKLAMVPCTEHCGGGYRHIDQDHFDRHMGAQTQLLEDVMAWEGQTPTNVFLAARWARAADYLADVEPDNEVILDDAMAAHEALEQAMLEWNGECRDCLKATIAEMDTAGELEAALIISRPNRHSANSVVFRAQA